MTGNGAVTFSCGLQALVLFDRQMLFVIEGESCVVCHAHISNPLTPLES